MLVEGGKIRKSLRTKNLRRKVVDGGCIAYSVCCIVPIPCAVRIAPDFQQVREGKQLTLSSAALGWIDVSLSQQF
jgi:hypothetical protein